MTHFIKIGLFESLQPKTIKKNIDEAMNSKQTMPPLNFFLFSLQQNENKS